MWRFRGVPYYLGELGRVLGVAPVLLDRTRYNQELYRVSVLLAQLCERYHKARKENGKQELSTGEWAQVRGTLQQAEQECAKLHAAAAASAYMINEAHQAFDLPAPARMYNVLPGVEHACRCPGTDPIREARAASEAK